MWAFRTFFADNRDLKGNIIIFVRYLGLRFGLLSKKTSSELWVFGNKSNITHAVLHHLWISRKETSNPITAQAVLHYTLYHTQYYLFTSLAPVCTRVAYVYLSVSPYGVTIPVQLI